jgi:hypothetical protein
MNMIPFSLTLTVFIGIIIYGIIRYV